MSKDAVVSRKTWKQRLSWLAGASLLVALYFGARLAWSPSDATAQAPKPAAPAAKPATKPAATVAAKATPSTPAPADPRNAVQLKVLAVVNGEEIGRQDLARECLRRNGKEVLEAMVNRQVISRACQKRGIQITEKDVDEEIVRVANRFGLSVDRWLTVLKQERNVERDQYRREIIWPTLALRSLAAAKIVVTEDELQKAYQSEYGPKIKARAIVVTSRERADQLRAAALQNPAEFSALSRQHSEDASIASASGLIPPIRLHMGDPELERVAFSLQRDGDISPIVKVGNQFIILRREQRLPETTIPPDKLRGLQEQLVERIRDNKLRETATDVFKQLQSEARVVNVYNDDKLRQQYPGVAALVDDHQISVQVLSEECLTRHGTAVLDGEINRRLLIQELRRRNKAVAEPDIDAEIARAADSYGYMKSDGKPDINKWLEVVTEGGDHASVDLYVRDAVWPTVALKKLVDETVKVTEDDLQKGFESNYGPRAEVLAIVMTNQRQAQKVWEMARNNPTDEFFGELASQYSVEPISKENNGKVPPLRRHGGQPVLEEEAFRLKKGELSGIVAVGDKYILIRSQGFTDPVVKQADDEIRRELYKDIHEKKLRIAMAKEFDRLKESSQIDNFLANTSQSPKRSGTGTASLPSTTRK